MGGATKQLLSRGGEKKLGEKEERVEEWWSRSSKKFSKVYRCEVSFLFFFFSRGEVSFGKSAFAIGKGTSLSLSFSNFSFELKRRNETNPRK